MFENVGGAEILVILIVVLIFFGPKKIPELAQSLGKGLRKFNDAKEGLESQVKTVFKEPLDAINEAKTGLEKKLNEASAPLKEQFNFSTVNTLPSVTATNPASTTTPDNPVLAAPADSIPRGTSITQPDNSVVPFDVPPASPWEGMPQSIEEATPPVGPKPVIPNREA